MDSLVDFYQQRWSPILLGVELILNGVFIWHGPLHPIDFPTYLTQIRTIFTQKTLDYSNLSGLTGPLVYPGGHVLAFLPFERLLGLSSDPNFTSYFPAQIAFIPLQLAVTYIVHQIYHLVSDNPHLDCLFFLFTIRARNVFVNGLFNDPLEVFFAYLALLFLLQGRKPAAVILAFSMAASIKMNALLYAPACLTHYLTTIGWQKTAWASRYGAGWQLIVGLPFMLANPYAYLARSFELEQSISWKFIPKQIFESAAFPIIIQLCHFATLTFFTRKQLSIYQEGTSTPLTISQTRRRIFIFFITTHFTGIMFARSLHYSFYIWYFHQIPALLEAGQLSWPKRISWAIALEVAWNQWLPFRGNVLMSCATWWGALAIFGLHGYLLRKLYLAVPPNAV